jgi:ferritin-like metal-binding protein YciE
LQATLDEERAADRKLTEIALNHLRVEATHTA